MAIDRMPIHSEFFLPARRTDLIAVSDYDIEAEHERLWESRDPRNKNEIKRPTYNNYIVAMLIAQGRMRRFAMKFYIKDPEIWRAEVIDVRQMETPAGRWRCQFCGQHFEKPRKDLKLIACWTCSELIGLRTYYDRNLWNSKRNLR